MQSYKFFGSVVANCGHATMALKRRKKFSEFRASITFSFRLQNNFIFRPAISHCTSKNARYTYSLVGKMFSFFSHLHPMSGQDKQSLLIFFVYLGTSHEGGRKGQGDPKRIEIVGKFITGCDCLGALKIVVRFHYLMVWICFIVASATSRRFFSTLRIRRIPI